MLEDLANTSVIPAIPYTDLHRYLEGVNSLTEAALTRLGSEILTGKGRMGLSTGVAYFYVRPTIHFQEAYPAFCEAEEIWLAVDLEAFLEGDL